MNKPCGQRKVTKIAINPKSEKFLKLTKSNMIKLKKKQFIVVTCKGLVHDPSTGSSIHSQMSSNVLSTHADEQHL